MEPYLVIITGESGAGKSTVLKALEDLDFLAIDNFPIRLLIPFLEEIKRGESIHKVALVMDLRDPFFLGEINNVCRTLKERGYNYDLLYLSADEPALITRFSQTRRPHPMLKEVKELRKAIELEKKQLSPLKEMATYHIDTSKFNVHQLRYEIFKIYGKRQALNTVLLHLISFGFKYGIPYEANYLFDARVLPNPYFVPELKPLTGADERVQTFLLEKSQTQAFIDLIFNFLTWAIPLHREEGRRYITCAIGCTGGRHRSPAITLILAEKFKKTFTDVEVVVTQRDVERE